MKKKISSMLVAIVLLLAQELVGVYPMSASALAWPETPFVYTNTSSVTTGVRFGIKGDKTTNKNIQNGEFAVIETTYTHADVNANYYIQLLGSDGGTGESYWEPVRFKTNGDIVVNHSAYGTPSSQVTIGKAVIGETYHIVAVIYTNGTQTNGRVFINGQEVSIGQYLQNNPATRPYYYIYGLPNSTTTITRLAGVTGIADFDYSDYKARITSTNLSVVVSESDHANFGIDTGVTPMTVSELMSSITLPEGAQAKVYLGDDEVLASERLESDMVLRVTSENGKTVLDYVITAGLNLIKSNVYGIDKYEFTISGLSCYTSVSEFLDEIALRDAKEIVGVVPAGNYITDGMKLAVLDENDETVYFDLILSDKYTQIVQDDTKYMIRGLREKLKGLKTVISGTINVPMDGLEQDIDLYFNMDVKKGYALNVTKDGEISIWGNPVGTLIDGASYDYSIVTNPSTKKCDAYINGIKVLSDASISDGYDADSDPYELIATNYNPKADGEFFLREIYSFDGYEMFYGESSVEVTAVSSEASVGLREPDKLYISLFVAESYTIEELKAAVSLPNEDAQIFFKDANGNEILDLSKTISELGYVEVTSKNGKYTAKYDVEITVDVLRSSLYEVDNTYKTIGKLLEYTPYSVFADSLEPRPGVTVLGVYREGALVDDGVISRSDVLKVEENGVTSTYNIIFVDDIANGSGVHEIPDGTKGTVTIIEGTYIYPKKNPEADGTTRIYFRNSANAAGVGEAWFFYITPSSASFKFWGKTISIAPGERYDYCIVNKHTTAKADVYLNGIKVFSDVSTSNLMATHTQFDRISITGAVDRDREFRFYRVYSEESFVYSKDLTLRSATNTVTYNPNLVTVTDVNCVTVNDLLDSLTFPDEFAKNSVKVYGNGAEVIDYTTVLRNDMYFTFSSSGGISGTYKVDLPKTPITSYVFSVEGENISYGGNLSYYDFVRHCILSKDTMLSVTKADGTPVTGGNIASGMKAIAGGVTYTITLSNTVSIPEISILSIEDDEIMKTADTYSKTIKTVGANISKAVVYLDGVEKLLPNTQGEHSFTKSGLSVGRHEIYAEVMSKNGKSITKKYAFYVFENEVERLRAAKEPVAMEANYLDGDGKILPKSDLVLYDKASEIELVFNKALLADSVNKESIRLVGGVDETEYSVRYVEDGETARYSVFITLDKPLKSSSEYAIYIGANLLALDGYTAKAESKIGFKTTPKSFGVLDSLVVDTGGKVVASPKGGDVVSANVTISNTSFEDKSGVVVFALYEGNKLVGYSLKEFTVSAGTVRKTISTDNTTIDSTARGNLTVHKYIWDDICGGVSMID